MHTRTAPFVPPCKPFLASKRPRCVKLSAAAPLPTSQPFQIFPTQPLDLSNITPVDDHFAHNCKTCRYPCDDRGGPCEAHDYLARWKEDDYLKPNNFDASAVASSCGIEVAATSVGGRANGRWKPVNQDAFLLQSLSTSPTPGSFLIGVFDGHGRLGHQVASRAKQAMLAATAAPSATSTDTSTNNNLATSSFPSHDADEDDHEHWMSSVFDFVANAVDSTDADFSRSGATAVVCAIQPGRVTAAWAGDSRAVLGMYGTHEGRQLRAVIPLTRDHKPDPHTCPHEAERILASGGRVDRLAMDRHGNPTGPFRVFLPDAWTPGLALTRAFGDHLVRDVGIVPTPEVHTMSLPCSILAHLGPGTNGTSSSSHGRVSNLAAACNLSSTARAGEENQESGKKGAKNRHVLIVASDGLWEWMSNEEAVGIASECETAEEASQRLTESAQKLWATKYRGRVCDDITVAVAYLPV